MSKTTAVTAAWEAWWVRPGGGREMRATCSDGQSEGRRETWFHGGPKCRWSAGGSGGSGWKHSPFGKTNLVPVPVHCET